MNAQKLTEKSLEAIQSANDMAISHQNQMIQQVHLLCALLEQENGLIPQLFEKVGVSKETAVTRTANTNLRLKILSLGHKLRRRTGM